MRKIIQLILIIGISFTSCDKNESIETENEFPVEFLLLESHKEIVVNFANNESLTFVSNDNDTIKMQSDGIKNNLFYNPNTTRRGEEMILYYTCQSDYLSTLKVGYQLEAINDSNSIISVTSISGNLENTARVQDYYASFAKLLVSKTSDSLFNYVNGYSYEFFDSLNINSSNYSNCYLLNKLTSFGWDFLSDYFYFNKDHGLIKFNTKDEKEWSLLNTNLR